MLHDGTVMQVPLVADSDTPPSIRHSTVKEEGTNRAVILPLSLKQGACVNLKSPIGPVVFIIACFSSIFEWLLKYLLYRWYKNKVQTYSATK